jgi:hypothetical protein
MLLLVPAASMTAQDLALNNSISVKFVVDGKAVPCDPKVDLSLNGQKIVPKMAGHSFTVPAAFNKRDAGWSADDHVDATISCGEYTVNVPQLSPAFVAAGGWEAGIANPPYWFEKFSHTPEIEKGAWISYIDFECDDCEPAIVVSVSHSEPLPPVVESLRKEQPLAKGVRARDIAYALAVFKQDYQRNREYLLAFFNACLAKSSESSDDDDDLCDDRLQDYLINLYWRGDDALLAPLLKAAGNEPRFVRGLGYFYGDLLDRRTAAALQGLKRLSREKQQTVCDMAGEDEFSVDSQKLEALGNHLPADDAVAMSCLIDARQGASRTDH